MTSIIQINDHQILIKKGESVAQSQGYAWLNDKSVYFDTDAEYSAIKQSRLTPQQVHNHYWQQCDQTSIFKNNIGMRNAADLIWRHLSELKAQHDLSDVIFVVPSHYQTDNLQLLLGIAKSCELNVLGLLNRAVVELQSQVSEAGDYLHFDIQLHQTVCSTLTAEEGELSLSNMEIIHDVGLLAMQDNLLKAIQHSFIHTDRFDPLHNAQTEQQLFDLLPQLAEQIKQSAKTNISLNFESRQHTANIDARQWQNAIQPLLDKLAKSTSQKQYKGVFYSYNGFQAAQINKLNSTVLSDSLAASAGQLLSWSQSDVNSDLVYVTQVPILLYISPSITTVPSNPQTEQEVTHLLQSGIAVPLHLAMIETNGTLELHKENRQIGNAQQLLDQGVVFIANDESRKTLQVNDRLTSHLADGVILAIQVKASEEVKE